MSNTPPFPTDMQNLQHAGDNPFTMPAVAGRIPEREESPQMDLGELVDAMNAQVTKSPVQCVLIAFGVGTVIGMIFSACGSCRE